MGLSPAEVEALCREAAQGEVLSRQISTAPGRSPSRPRHGRETGGGDRFQTGGKESRAPAGERAFPLPPDEACGRKAPGGARAGGTGDLTFPVISNVEADVYPGKDRIKELLFQQVDHPVRWEESMRKMVAMGPELVLETGRARSFRG